MRARRAPAFLALLIPALLAACVHDVHRVGPVGAPSPPTPAELRVLLFGDFGYRSPQQWLVARAMRRAARAEAFDFGVQLGDNLYRCGPDPTRPAAQACRFADDGVTIAPGVPAPDDPIFSRLNERALDGLRDRAGAPLPTYMVLGNHDIGWDGGGCSVAGLSDDEAMRRRACLNVAHRGPHWTAPGRRYVLDRGPVRIVVVDTNVVVADYGGFTLEDEIAFLARATAPCGPELLCFIAGHHPPAVVRGRGGALPYAERMARLLAAAGGRAEAFFAGHYHALGHLTLDGLEVFVSGSTAMGAFGAFRARTPARAQLRFATTAWGYTVLEAHARGYRVLFRDFQGVPLHCCEAERGGPCRSVECG